MKRKKVAAADMAAKIYRMTYFLQNENINTAIK